jgi:hypothetical protein
MRRLWPLLVVALLCLPAASPYLIGDIPRTNDALTHLYRAVELDRLVRAGVLIPRWAPDFAHGYGYPIFNYFAYLSHYLIVVIHLIGLPMLWAMRAAFTVALLGSGLSAFLLGRDLADGDDGAGVVAAVAYVYSPYLLYTAHVRGGLPENLALAFLPLALWAVRRSLLTIHHEGSKTRWDTKEIWKYAALAALAVAGFIASHIGMALHYLPLVGVLGLYLIARGWRLDVGRWTLGVGILSAVFAAALGLTAFLWLPSVAELGFVQFDAAFARAGLTYQNNFFDLGDLFAYPRVPVYTSVLNPPVIRALPLVALGLALIGLLRPRSAPPSRRADYLFILALFLITTLLITNYSRFIWDFLPLLQRSTFPWRLLGPASLCLSLLAGQCAMRNAQFTKWNTHYALRSSFVVSLLLLSAVPFLIVPRESAPDSPSRADLARFEIPPLLVATTTTGEYTPNWVNTFPDTRDQQAALLEGREPERLELPGASVEHLAAQPARDIYRVTLADAATAVYHSFYFPGWDVTLDGRPLPFHPTDPHGLITFDLPPGEHTLEIRFGDTPIRTAANALSLISLAALAYGAACIAYRPSSPATDYELRPADHGWDLGFGVLGFGFSSLFIASLFIARPVPPPVQHRLGFDFGGELTLYGYDLGSYASGDHTGSLLQAITLIWQAQHPIGVAYGMNLRLVDERGLIWSDTDIERPRDWRFFPGTDFWKPDQYVYDSYVLKPTYGAPPGLYRLEVIVYRADTLQALSTQIIGDYVIERAANQAFVEPIVKAGAAAVIAASADREAAAPGDLYRLDLTWQARFGARRDDDFCATLIDERLSTLAHRQCQSVTPGYPPAKWKVGDVLKQALVFRLPAYLKSGGYHWRLDTDFGEVELPIKLQINAPDRTFDLPSLDHPLKVEFDEPVSLLGYNLATNGNQITVELAWQARREMNEPYRAFLHLLDKDGNLVSQSDGEPADWSRPTTGWLAGEVVVDSRTLTAPGPGEYTLQAGLVTEAGERLSAADWPEGAVRLGAVRVAP